MTRWPRYFHGLNIAEAASLAYAANPITEPALVLLGESFDRLIEQAYQSVCKDKISVFDQANINNFITNRSATQDRQLIVKLQKSTHCNCGSSGGLGAADQRLYCYLLSCVSCSCTGALAQR